MPIARKCMLMPRYDRYFYLTCRVDLIAMEYIQLRRSLGLYTVYLPQASTRPYAIVNVSVGGIDYVFTARSACTR